MFRLSISPKKCKSFSLDFDTEQEVYDAIFYLESNLSGIADYSVFFNDKRFLVGTLGKAPQRVFNAFTRTYYSFEEFLRKPFDFPLTTRLLFRKYLNMDNSRIYGLY